MHYPWTELDQRHCWHPFTDQRTWCDPAHEPLMLVRGEGPWLFDTEGNKYFDGNSSIWTNIHGHAHPVINAAIREQLERVAHTSFLGFGHPLASELAAKLCAFFPNSSLERVFFSDDGSTAMETALKMAIQYRQQTGEPQRTGFVAFHHAYHGDTMGAASLGGVSAFFERFRSFGMPVRFVADLTELEALPAREIAAVVIEPLIQGVNGMRPWPKGMLRELRAWCDRHGVHLILDEVMTGFGRTGTMFACQQEGVVPDFLCVAKGITGGYLPLAATLTTREVHAAFCGGPSTTFYYGHSYTANPLGCAAALASLRIFEEDRVLENLAPKIARLAQGLADLQGRHALVRDVRQCGMVAGIELDAHHRPRIHEEVCFAARKHGLLTRPVPGAVVLMPPLCGTLEEIDFALDALNHSIAQVSAIV